MPSSVQLRLGTYLPISSNPIGFGFGPTRVRARNELGENWYPLNLSILHTENWYFEVFSYLK